MIAKVINKIRITILIYILLKAYANIVHYNIISLKQDEDQFLQQNRHSAP